MWEAHGFLKMVNPSPLSFGVKENLTEDLNIMLLPKGRLESGLMLTSGGDIPFFASKVFYKRQTSTSAGPDISHL